ncbi:dTDP-4-amino-4,6-dideoxygalactose transaminase [Planococcus maritimus]|uniref:dTDP-4-amino-4,6-dideoxygalactose transaminase n=1 Tax=Planococcus maritimus TaxID=192421 RepID=UPI00084C3676|nr:dTDP-4-amino-4,6-dideoxygalactose transaminase [Planococcus maritimus]OED33123.1 dTDP-4-amino-4,6-dideoxygalactose transaminase [Planococcus maritimus]
MKIPFNIPPYMGKELIYVKQAIEVNKKISGDGLYTTLCHEWLENNNPSSKALLTTSCTHALEMTAMLIDIQEGDEVIVPSYTFVSSVNAFVIRGAKIKFVDIRPDTMNIDENLIESAITSKTKAIIPVHYAGVACEMDKIMEIARKYDLYVIEDAAQALMSTYKGKALGSIGDFGCFSFHETKNYSMGEGGALLIQNELFKERAEIIREKGTNRSKFIRGQVDKYTWVDKGSSYLPSEINAAYLFAQLEEAKVINQDRLKSWQVYFKELYSLAQNRIIEIPSISNSKEHNAHMFYIKCKDIKERTSLIKFLQDNGVQSAFHYIPLHSATAGKVHGEFIGEDKFTTSESERLVRLPLFYGLEEKTILFITSLIKSYYIKGED